jgi:hypothetical protein
MRENKSLFVATGTGGPLFYSKWIDGLSSAKIDYSTGNLEVSLLNFHSTSIPSKFRLKKREVIEVAFECEIAHTQTIEMSAVKKIELNKIENIFLSLPFS